MRLLTLAVLGLTITSTGWCGGTSSQDDPNYFRISESLSAYQHDRARLGTDIKFGTLDNGQRSSMVFGHLRVEDTKPWAETSSKVQLDLLADCGFIDSLNNQGVYASFGTDSDPTTHGTHFGAGIRILPGTVLLGQYVNLYHQANHVARDGGENITGGGLRILSENGLRSGLQFYADLSYSRLHSQKGGRILLGEIGPSFRKGAALLDIRATYSDRRYTTKSWDPGVLIPNHQTELGIRTSLGVRFKTDGSSIVF